MKIIPCLVSVLLAVNLSAFLQLQVYAQNISVGAKGGLSVPNLTAGDTQNPLNKGYSSRLGADAGVYVQYHFNDIFSASIGTEYCAQGGKKSGLQAFPVPAEYQAYVPPGTKYLYADYRGEAKLDYLLIPLLARVQYSVRNPVSIYAAAGPFFGILMKAEQETRGTSYIYLDERGTQVLFPSAVSFNADNNIRSETNRFNSGIAGFVGISADIGRYSVFAEGGGNFGFVPIQKKAENGKNYIGAAVVTAGCAYTFGD